MESPMTPSSTVNIRELLVRCKSAFISVVIFSALVNLLALVVPLYTLQLYDRVMASQNTDTLFYLSFIAFFAIVIYGLLEYLRGIMVTVTAHWFDQQINPGILTQSVDRLLQGNRYGYDSQRDLAMLKNFLKSPSFFSFLDIPWFPIYLIALFMISGVLGCVALIGAAILFFLAYVNQKITALDLTRASKLNIHNTHTVDEMLNHAEVMQGMGMVSAFLKKWMRDSERSTIFQIDERM